MISRYFSSVFPFCLFNAPSSCYFHFFFKTGLFLYSYLSFTRRFRFSIVLFFIQRSIFSLPPSLKLSFELGRPLSVTLFFRSHLRRVLKKERKKVDSSQCVDGIHRIKTVETPRHRKQEEMFNNQL